MEDITEQVIEDRKNRPVDFSIKCVNNDVVTFTGRPCELSAFSHVPQNRMYEAPARSIYNAKSNKNNAHITDYDRLHKVGLFL